VQGGYRGGCWEGRRGAGARRAGRRLGTSSVSVEEDPSAVPPQRACDGRDGRAGWEGYRGAKEGCPQR